MEKSPIKDKDKEEPTEKKMTGKKKDSKPTSMIEEDPNIKFDPMKMINSKARSESKSTSKKLKKSNESINLAEDDDINDLFKDEVQVVDNKLTYTINSHRIFATTTLLSYADSLGNKKMQELKEIKIPKFRKVLVGYIESKKLSNADKKKILDVWDATHEPEVEEVPEVLEVCEKDLFDPVDFGKIPKDRLNDELDSIDKHFPKYYQELIDKQTEPFMKHLISLGRNVKRITYLKDNYKLEFDFGSYFRGNNIPKKMRDDLLVSAGEMYDPILIYNMHQFAVANEREELRKLALKLFKTHYKGKLWDIHRRLNIVNGAMDPPIPLSDYIKHKKVAKFLIDNSIDDINTVYGFRREFLTSTKEGYVKYYECREKSRFIYFSFSDIKELISEKRFDIFINKVYTQIQNEESQIRSTVDYLKNATLYKKGKQRLNSKMKKENAKKFDLNNGCFIEALVPVVGTKIPNKISFKYPFTGKTLEQQIEMINNGNHGFLLSERNEVSAKLKEFYDSIKVKCILVFKTSDLVSHTVPVIPGEEYTDYAFDAYVDEVVKIRVVDIHES